MIYNHKNYLQGKSFMYRTYSYKESFTKKEVVKPKGKTLCFKAS